MITRNNLVTLRPGDTVLRAIERMAKYDVSSVLVQKDHDIKGIVTSQDIFTIIASRKSAGLTKPIEDIMTTDLIAIDSKQSKNTAIKLMEEKQVHHLLVKDKSGNYIGIISSIDLVEETSLDLKAHPWIRKQN